jgi:molecular chaperone GrpE
MPKFDTDNKGEYIEHIEHDPDDVQLEPEEEIVMEETQTDKLKALRTKLKKAETERTEYLAGWQRAKADAINSRREAEETRIRQAGFATARLIEDLLPVLDSFQMARENSALWETAPENWRKGIEHIQNQLQTILKGHGLEEIKAEGEFFDPTLHDAAGMESVGTEKEDGTVWKVLQCGYQLGGQVIRPARVLIGEYIKGG